MDSPITYHLSPIAHRPSPVNRYINDVNDWGGTFLFGSGQSIFRQTSPLNYCSSSQQCPIAMPVLPNTHVVVGPPLL